MQPHNSHKTLQANLFAAMLPHLMPPCGCIPTLIQGNCVIANWDRDSLEIKIINPNTNNECECGWKDDKYIMAIAKALAILDPNVYGDKPLGASPISTISREERIAIMEQRIADGRSLWHPKDDYFFDDDRRGETSEGRGKKKRRRVVSNQELGDDYYASQTTNNPRVYKFIA